MMAEAFYHQPALKSERTELKEIEASECADVDSNTRKLRMNDFNDSIKSAALSNREEKLPE